MVLCKKSLNSSIKLVTFKAEDHIVKQSKTEKLLGANLSQDMKWQEHIMDNDSSIIKQLKCKINILALLAKRASFKNRLMLPNGLVISKLSYLIQLWGRASDFLLKSLQTLTNKAAQLVTNKLWFTPTWTLLRECNWLSVRN